MKLTKTQKILLGTAIAGIGGYFLYKYLIPTNEESDEESEPDKKDSDAGTGLIVLPGNTGVVPLPVIVPPKNDPIVIQSTLKKGDKVNAKVKTATYSGYTLANPYKSGGNDRYGNFLTGNYVGVILQIVGNAVQVQRYSRPYVGKDMSYFWVLASNVEKSLL